MTANENDRLRARDVVADIGERRALMKALDALDTLSEAWAEEANIRGMCANIAKAADLPEAIYALVVQAWVEGAYAGRTSHQDSPAIAALAAPEGCGVALIAAERQRQISVEGWTPQHDDDHGTGQMARAAAAYATGRAYAGGEPLWPWDEEWWKPSPNDRVRELTKAGALIAAEIDRLQRAAGVPTR